MKKEIPRSTRSTEAWARTNSGVRNSPTASKQSVDLEGTINETVLRALSDGEIQQQIVSLIVSKVTSAVMAELATLRGEVADLKAELSARDTVIEGMQRDLSEQAKANDGLEQYQRRANVRVFGVPEMEGEDTDESVIELVKSKMNIAITKRDIDRSHRVGAKKTQRDEGGSSAGETSNNQRPRAIIVKFMSYRVRAQILQGRSRLAKSGITIKEDLTQTRMSVLNKAIELHGLRNVWTIDGRVHWRSTDGVKRSATTIKDVK